MLTKDAEAKWLIPTDIFYHVQTVDAKLSKISHIPNRGRLIAGISGPSRLPLQQDPDRSREVGAIPGARGTVDVAVPSRLMPEPRACDRVWSPLEGQWMPLADGVGTSVRA